MDELLSEMSGTTPLFPLPDFVFFPKTMQPFHIFEARYRTMMKDALAGDRLITIPLIRQTEESNGHDPENPSFYPIATIGHITKYQELEDGNYNVLMTGLSKVEVTEIDSDKAYRRCAVTLQKDFTQVTDGDNKIRNLVKLFARYLEKTETPGSVQILEQKDLPVEMIAHILISALPVEAEEKQKMLELQSLELRMDILTNFLESGLHTFGRIGKFAPILPDNPQWN